MHTFTDNAKRTWTIAITVDAVKRVRASADVNLLGIIDAGLLDRLIRDPVLLCDVIYAACKPDADRQNITAEQFGQAMAGDAIDEATRALLEDLVDFFPNAQDRATLRRILESTWKVMDRARTLVAQRVTDGTLDRYVEKALRDAEESLDKASAPSGTPLGSSASTPVP